MCQFINTLLQITVMTAFRNIVNEVINLDT